MRIAGMLADPPVLDSRRWRTYPTLPGRPASSNMLVLPAPNLLAFFLAAICAASSLAAPRPALLFLGSVLKKQMKRKMIQEATVRVPAELVAKKFRANPDSPGRHVGPVRRVMPCALCALVVCAELSLPPTLYPHCLSLSVCFCIAGMGWWGRGRGMGMVRTAWLLCSYV